MFDPTAFDNMKVVIEGALYDFDMQGTIVITDRNDWHNLAKMARLFSVSFSLPNSKMEAKMELETGILNLAAELLPDTVAEKNAGCFVRLQFTMELEDNIENFQTVEVILKKVWGETRIMKQTVEYNPLGKQPIVKNRIMIDFDRLIKEEQMEDLVEMTEFMVITLQQLQNFLDGQ
ncbi:MULTISPECIES: hypothetical protein [Bacillaceae]|uniref:hypothetical protein n=1 Tax=Bacillaceae TaxID=186817 RepID=UPI002FFF95CA